MLFVFQSTYKQRTVFLGYDIAVEPLHDDPFSRRYMHDATMRIDHLHGISHTGIAGLIMSPAMPVWEIP